MLPTPIVRNLDERVYEPAEDSFLLLDCLEERHTFLTSKFKNQTPVVCEIGAGSGVVSTFIKTNVLPDGLFLATDINPTACKSILETAKYNDPFGLSTVDLLQMSLTSAVRRNVVDVLVFNPPYVPAEEVPPLPATEEDDSWVDLALLGGADGMVVTWEVLNSLDDIMAKDGVAYILFCARNKPDEVAQIMENKGWKVVTVVHRKAGWEVLSVLEFRRR